MDVTHDQIAQLYRRHLSTSLRVAVPSHPPPPPTRKNGLGEKVQLHVGYLRTGGRSAQCICLNLPLNEATTVSCVT